MCPHHWFLFANDSTLVISTEEDSQLLLNVLTKWCTWVSLIIKVSKRKTFGIKKYGCKSVQFKPYLQTNNELIPPCKNQQVVCLCWNGIFILFDMKLDKMKETLLKDLNQYMEVIDRLNPKKKLMIVSRYFYSKLKWNLTIYEVSETWTTIQNLGGWGCGTGALR